ncbi:Hypothetical predicted protein [Paramuricea clavata]|uniref:Uncharacterized protein n=1 Tax=Paramuricea clavata TaxID=317549 RepID=A0A7D9F036_PARCT|nr:Hypothetical predicted protein [Paramuricea clavata]
MERMLLIKVNKRNVGFRDEEAAKWTGRFGSILDNVSSMVGHIVKLGQELHTADGQKYFASCSEVAAEWLNTDSDRLIKMWASALFCARKMAKYTTAVSEEDILQHFKSVLAPYVFENQVPQMTEPFLSPSSWSSQTSGETVVKALENILLDVTKGEDQTTVQRYLSTDIRSRANDATVDDSMIAIRVRHLRERCKTKHINCHVLNHLSTTVSATNIACYGNEVARELADTNEDTPDSAESGASTVIKASLEKREEELLVKDAKIDKLQLKLTDTESELKEKGEKNKDLMELLSSRDDEVQSLNSKILHLQEEIAVLKRGSECHKNVQGLPFDIQSSPVEPLQKKQKPPKNTATNGKQVLDPQCHV